MELKKFNEINNNPDALASCVIDSYFGVVHSLDTTPEMNQLIKRFSDEYINDLIYFLEEKNNSIDKHLYTRKIISVINKIGRQNCLRLIDFYQNVLKIAINPDGFSSNDRSAMF